MYLLFSKGLSPLPGDSGTSRALLGVGLGAVVLDARLPTPASDKTVLDFIRIRLVQRRVGGSLNILGLVVYQESKRSTRGIKGKWKHDG